MALATQVANPAPGRDARYSLSGLTKLPDGTYTDGVYKYDDSGRGINRPNSTVSGLPPANSSESYNVYTGQTSASGPLGGGGGGGANPMDSYTRQLQSLLDSQSAAQKADTRAAIQQALIGYGVVPTGFKDELGALDDTTRALIQKNTDTGISGYARMLQDKQDAQRSMLAALSSKGLRRSGAKGFLGRRGQLDWDRKSADATAALLQNIGAAQKSFAEGEQQRKMQLLQALFSQQFQGGFASQGDFGTPIGPSAPSGGASYGAPAFQSQYLTGQQQPSGYAVPTGGGWYTNQQTGKLTNKWQQLGKMG